MRIFRFSKKGKPTFVFVCPEHEGKIERWKITGRFRVEEPECPCDLCPIDAMVDDWTEPTLVMSRP